jgi:hypothetical protein
MQSSYKIFFPLSSPCTGYKGTCRLVLLSFLHSSLKFYFIPDFCHPTSICLGNLWHSHQCPALKWGYLLCYSSVQAWFIWVVVHSRHSHLQAHKIVEFGPLFWWGCKAHYSTITLYEAAFLGKVTSMAVNFCLWSFFCHALTLKWYAVKPQTLWDLKNSSLYRGFHYSKFTSHA